MRCYDFPLTPFVHAHMAGHFSAPSGKWQHMSRSLSEYELMLVTEGTLWIADDTASYEIHPGEYVIIPPTPHQHGTRPGSCSFFWLHFFVDPKNVAARTLSLPVTGRLSHLSRFSVLFSQFYDIYQHDTDTYTVDLFATGLLLEIHRQLQEQTSSSDASGYRLYQKILEYIEWNSGYRISVEQIARYLDYHPKYISTVFHRYHDDTLKHYLMKCVMDHAKAELAYSGQSITDLAEHMGFHDVHHFSSSFRRVVGVSPRQYRNSFDGIPVNHV